MTVNLVDDLTKFNNQSYQFNTSINSIVDHMDEEILTEEFVMASNQCMCLGEINEKDYSPNYAMYNLIVIIVLLPIVALFGLFSNVVNIYIFTRPRMISSSSVYLTALAFSDFMVVVTGLFIFCLDSTRGYITDLNFFATKSIIYILPVGYMAQTGSVYFTVGAAIDCYMNVCWEPFSRGYCSVRRAKQYVFCVLLFTLSYNALRFWQYFLHECYYLDELSIEFCPTALHHKINIIYNVYMYMILMTFLPFILLSILNAFIVRKVQNKKITKSFHDTSKSVVITNFPHAYQLCPTSTPPNNVIDNPSDNGNDDDTVITMVMVVILFLVCNVLALVINVVETFFETSKLLLNYLSDTSNFLVVFNSSVNFLIYILFDGQYRKVLQARIRPCQSNVGNGASRLEIRTDSTLQTIVSNDGCETAL